jgi:hypothetical protein
VLGNTPPSLPGRKARKEALAEVVVNAIVKKMYPARRFRVGRFVPIDDAKRNGMSPLS